MFFVDYAKKKNSPCEYKDNAKSILLKTNAHTRSQTQSDSKTERQRQKEILRDREQKVKVKLYLFSDSITYRKP